MYDIENKNISCILQKFSLEFSINDFVLILSIYLFIYINIGYFYVNIVHFPIFSL